MRLSQKIDLSTNFTALQKGYVIVSRGLRRADLFQRTVLRTIRLHRRMDHGLVSGRQDTQGRFWREHYNFFIGDYRTAVVIAFMRPAVQVSLPYQPCCPWLFWKTDNGSVRQIA
ncbi:hypothetical protein BB934_44390 (plasmid) [Microvirga ossetica]|uniref:Uncharacterized protein n=1 Tax=Microvirga ossetica TaxID=1882682 RepID=A0A1B2EZ14_9HYPH|nr:hypothetical protein BB934_44390 [Microvirga ossetica]